MYPHQCANPVSPSDDSCGFPTATAISPPQRNVDEGLLRVVPPWGTILRKSNRPTPIIGGNFLPVPVRGLPEDLKIRSHAHIALWNHSNVGCPHRPVESIHTEVRKRYPDRKPPTTERVPQFSAAKPHQITSYPPRAGVRGPAFFIHFVR